MNSVKQLISKMTINGREIGDQCNPYIIAELSGNHRGQLAQALNLIDAAADANADAIKIQTYKADTITLNHDGPEFQLTDGLWQGRTLFDLYEEAHTPWEWHPAIFQRAKERGITLFSSPFDTSAVDLLENLNCPAYKIASFEITDIGLIKYAASTGKPIIMSTGLASLDEINEAVQAVVDVGGNQLALLHCVSGYPTPIEDCNLRTITDLKSRFLCPIGLSDHTIDNTASIAATCIGACIIEKHFVMDREDGSVDAAFSLEPDEFKDMVKECNRAQSAMGKPGYDIKPSEQGGLVYRRSLYCSKDIKKGQKFDRSNVRSVRPALGLHTRYLPDILGKTATKDVAFGTPIHHSMIESFDINQ